MFVGYPTIPEEVEEADELVVVGSSFLGYTLAMWRNRCRLLKRSCNVTHANKDTNFIACVDHLRDRNFFVCFDGYIDYEQCAGYTYVMRSSTPVVIGTHVANRESKKILPLKRRKILLHDEHPECGSVFLVVPSWVQWISRMKIHTLPLPNLRHIIKTAEQLGLEITGREVIYRYSYGGYILPFRKGNDVLQLHARPTSPPQTGSQMLVVLQRGDKCYYALWSKIRRSRYYDKFKRALSCL